VPVHFRVDAYGLAQDDGTALYEYPNNAIGVSEWGSYNFMHSRGEVRSFLQSAANCFLSCYHFDGLRIDAISRIIYWQGEERRGENGNAIDFLKTMNQGLKRRHRGILLIAEDSTSYAGVTKPVADGGLGFDYKWDLGWMHDTLKYFQLPPSQRSEQYHKLTFSMMYFRNEQYLLPFSHDEVVHGKATILQKMNGDYENKFPQAKALYLYMYVHPGKKLNFMGNEIGQLREWDEKREQDWDLRKYPTHDSFYRFMSELNTLYLAHPALSELDYREEGFAWIDCHQEEKCVYAISRKNRTEELIAIFNFSDREQSYTLPEQYTKKKYERRLCTDWEKYGGSCPLSGDVITVGTVQLGKFSGVLLKIL
ncbi:MAG: alpha amylase C-terminal domain-containing protein, partial [Lachnospiraceae bacterium]|nr:alpha amylase C-terminal domain-containing protein [Lachnospiraceae bacterium]